MLESLRLIQADYKLLFIQQIVLYDIITNYLKMDELNITLNNCVKDTVRM